MLVKVFTREILDSRGIPTIEVDVYLDDGSFGRAAIPSGASIGANEACEIRDRDNSRYFGNGVKIAISNVHMIESQLNGRRFASQRDFDMFLIDIDGTDQKSNLGANSLLGISLAFAKASAISNGQMLWQYISDIFGASCLLSERLQPPPYLMMNLINGGAHADNRLDVQECMIVPQMRSSVAESMRCGSEVFYALRKLLCERKHRVCVGDEGGFAPEVNDVRDALDLILEAIIIAGYKVGNDVQLGLDVAATHYYDNCSARYSINGIGGNLSTNDLLRFYENLLKNYPIFSFEDPFSDVDCDGWRMITENIGNKVKIIGDDIFVTNSSLLRRGIEFGVGNAILIKPNQVGTLTETIDAIALADKNQYSNIISHRSGETEDTTIAHIAAGVGALCIKSGAPSRSERTCKYNELLRIFESR